MHIFRASWVEHSGGAIYAIAVQPDSLRFATGGADCKVKIWPVAPLLSSELEAQSALRSPLYVGSHHGGGVRALCWTASGSVLLSGGEDGVVILWMLYRSSSAAEEWLPVRSCRGHAKEVTSIAVSPCDTYFASAARDGHVALWRLHDAAAVPVLDMQEHEGACVSVAWDPMGRLLASYGSDSTLRLYTAPVDERLQLPRTHSAMAWLAGDVSGGGSHTGARVRAGVYNLTHSRSDGSSVLECIRVVHSASEAFADTSVPAIVRHGWSSDAAAALCAPTAMGAHGYTAGALHRGGFTNATGMAGHVHPVTAMAPAPAVMMALEGTGIARALQADGGSRAAPRGGHTFTLHATGSSDGCITLWASQHEAPALAIVTASTAPLCDMAWGYIPHHDESLYTGAATSAAFVPAAGAAPFLLTVSLDGAVTVIVFDPGDVGVAASHGAAVAHVCDTYGVRVDAVDAVTRNHAAVVAAAAPRSFRVHSVTGSTLASGENTSSVPPLPPASSTCVLPAAAVASGSVTALARVSPLDIALWAARHAYLYGGASFEGVVGAGTAATTSTRPCVPRIAVDVISALTRLGNAAPLALAASARASGVASAAAVKAAQVETVVRGKRRITPVCGSDALEMAVAPAPTAEATADTMNALFGGSALAHILGGNSSGGVDGAPLRMPPTQLMDSRMGDTEASTSVADAVPVGSEVAIKRLHALLPFTRPRLPPPSARILAHSFLTEEEREVLLTATMAEVASSPAAPRSGGRKRRRSPSLSDDDDDDVDGILRGIEKHARKQQRAAVVELLARLAPAALQSISLLPPVYMPPRMVLDPVSMALTPWPQQQQQQSMMMPPPPHAPAATAAVTGGGMARFCGACGHRHADGDMFCIDCGRQRA